jgi:hypothetical protein
VRTWNEITVIIIIIVVSVFTHTLLPSISPHVSDNHFYRQWRAIEVSYKELHMAFREENPCCSDDEELQFAMFGSDFVFDLLCLQDLLAPLVSLMEIAQDLQLPHWKVAVLADTVDQYLARRADRFRVEDYPRLQV